MTKPYLFLGWLLSHPFSYHVYFSQSGKIKGALFIRCDHYKSVNTVYDSPNIVINTTQGAAFLAGTSSSEYRMQSTYRGAMWNAMKTKSESHMTRASNQFIQPVTLHGPQVEVEQSPGSAPVSNLITTNPITYLDVLDHHDSSSKSQKSLSMGAALVLKLALTLSMGNPFAAPSIPSAMASAGYSTLCSEAMVCLVENDGNPGRAMHALGERNIGKSIVRSLATAGLTKGIGGLCGVTDALTIPNLARQYLIQSAITTTMSVVVDKQNIGDAMRQGATSAVVNTVAAWSAGQIGDLASEKMGAAKISSSTQTGLHFATGAAAGGISAVILGGDIGKEALARGAGAVVGHKLAEMSLDMGASMNTAAHLGNIGTVGLAMLTNQDVMAAYQGSSNAIEYNCSRHQLNPIKNLVKAIKKGMEVKEGETATPEQEAYERGRQLYVKDSLEIARQLNGGPLSEESAERIVSNAEELYETKYTADLCGAMTGKTIVGASELIPGMRGVNKAWMGVVNHMRGDLSDGQLADEILAGIHSALTDAAFCVATAGAAHYYRSAKMAVGAAKEAAKVGGAGFKSVSGNIHDVPITWTAPTGTGQTYKVWQRTDIDWNMVRTNPKGAREFVGRTNREAAHAGIAPELADGFSATLHHINQNGLGNLVEASTRYHGVGKPGQNALHSLHGKLDGKPRGHPTNPIDRPKFDQDKMSYWRQRIAGVE